MTRTVACLFVLLLAGCPTEPLRGPESLVDHTAWMDVLPSNDPWLDEKPPDDVARCDALAVYEEEFGGDSTLTVDLPFCNYTVQVQPSRVAVEAGDLFTLRLWHDGFFFAAEEEPVHLAVRIGDVDVWEVLLPAPGDSGLEYVQWRRTADGAFPVGTPVYFLVNSHQIFEDHGARHGANSLQFIELSRADPGWVEPDSE